jgi:hypothetical protein
MGMRRQGSIILIVAVLVMVICGVVGCKRPQSKPAPQPQSSEQKEPPPGELRKLQESLEKFYEELKPEPAAVQQQKKGGEAGGQGGQGSQGGQSGQGGQQGQGGTKKQTPEKPDWNKLGTQAEKIHLEWSKLEHQVMKAGARSEDVAGIERELNLLPAMISAQDRSGARLAANNAAGYLPDFMKLYATKVPPDLMRLRYLERDVANRVDDGDWAGADQDMIKMRETWALALVQMKEGPKKETGEVHFAMEDLEEAVTTRDRELVLIKAGILEQNLAALIKKLEAKM